MCYHAAQHTIRQYSCAFPCRMLPKHRVTISQILVDPIVHPDSILQPQMLVHHRSSCPELLQTTVRPVHPDSTDSLVFIRYLLHSTTDRCQGLSTLGQQLLQGVCRRDLTKSIRRPRSTYTRSRSCLRSQRTSGTNMARSSSGAMMLFGANTPSIPLLPQTVKRYDKPLPLDSTQISSQRHYQDPGT